MFDADVENERADTMLVPGMCDRLNFDANKDQAGEWSPANL